MRRISASHSGAAGCAGVTARTPCARGQLRDTAEPALLAGLVLVRKHQWHPHALIQQHLQAALTDFAVGKYDCAKHGWSRAPADARDPLPGQVAQHRRDQIARSAADLLIGATDVFADEADAEQRQAQQEEHDGEQGEHALHVRTMHDAVPDQVQEQQQRDARNDHAEHREQLQRHHREAGHQVEVQPDQLVERVLGLAGMTRFMPRPRFPPDCARYRYARAGMKVFTSCEALTASMTWRE